MLLKGMIQTVTGPIASKQSGFTLPLEHLLADPTQNWTPPTEAYAREVFYASLSDETIALGRYYGMRSLAVGRLGKITDVIDEVGLFKQWGGGSIVDATGSAGGRDPVGLARIARATGINVIMTASPPPVNGADARGPEAEQVMAATIAREISTGVGETHVRAGLISNDNGDGRPADDPLTLRACGLAHLSTGAPIFVRPGPRDTDPLAVLAVLSELEVPHEAVTFAHMGRHSRHVVKGVVDSGCRIVLDGFGQGPRPVSHYTIDSELDTGVGMSEVARWPGDTEMLETIEWLASDGHANQILVSHNISSVDRYLKHGGHGYFYLLANVVPRMQAVGLGEALIDKLLVQNPAEALTFRAPVNG